MSRTQEGAAVPLGAVACWAPGGAPGQGTVKPAGGGRGPLADHRQGRCPRRFAAGRRGAGPTARASARRPAPGAPSPPALLYSPSALNANVTPRSGREEAGAHSEPLPGGHLGPVLVAGTGAPWRPCPTPGSRRTRAASRISRRQGPWPRAAPVATVTCCRPFPGLLRTPGRCPAAAPRTHTVRSDAFCAN